MSDLHFLQQAVKQAKKSVEQGGFPAGAVLVKNEEVIAEGVSLGFLLHDPTSHAETSSIRAACKKLETTDLAGATLYASLQPCLMCYCVANWANVSRIVYACQKTDEMVTKSYYEGKNKIEEVNNKNTHQIEIEYLADFEEEMLDLIKNWEKSF